MDTARLLALHDKHQRIGIEEQGMRREAVGGIVRHVNLRPDGEGTVIYSRLETERADGAIAEQVAYFRSIGQGFEWKLYGHDMPPDLGKRLLAAGFEAEDPESLLVLDLERAPAALLGPVTHDVRRISDPRRMDEVDRIVQSVWGESDPGLIQILRDDLAEDPEHTGIFIAYADGTPVAYARITYHDGSPFAGLWGGSTLQAYRNRGFYTALLAVRLQEARRRGVRYLTIDASPMSRPIAEKHGFRFLTTTQPFKWRNETTGDRP